MNRWLLDKFRVSIPAAALKEASLEDVREVKSNWENIIANCFEFLAEKLKEIYEVREKEVGADALRELEKMIFLHVIDMRWKQHLYALDYLREGIGLRAYGQRDPLVEYRNESYNMFQEMTDRIKLDVLEYLYKFHPRFEAAPVGLMEKSAQDYKHEEINQFQAVKKMAKSEESNAAHVIPGQSAGGEKAEPYRRAGKKVGRNDPCPCGSEKKFKKCCLN